MLATRLNTLPTWFHCTLVISVKTFSHSNS